MSANIQKMTKILVDDKKLYDESGKVFTYLNQLKVNFNNISYHNIAWQYSQIIEIVYSNKLEGINLNIFDVIIEFTLDNSTFPKIRDIIKANFNTTIYVSNFRKNNDEIPYALFENILKKIYSYKNYSSQISENEIISKATLDEKEVIEKLINSKYSNNDLYFVGLFLYLYSKVNKKAPFLSIARSVVLNLYLMKAKLLFAPTLCISYPLYHNKNNYNYLLEEINDDPKEITEFTRVTLDIIKQAAIINRAFVNKVIIINSSLEELNEKNKFFKSIKNKNIFKLLKFLCFDKKIVYQCLEIDDVDLVEQVINEMLKQKLIVNISNNEDKKVYMFKELFLAIKKLNRNKSQATSEIFILREDVS